MANEVLSQLDTGDVAERFNDFLESQGLGDMEPTSAARFRDGVEISPMDEILALNGIDLETLFKKKLPEPTPLTSITREIAETDGSQQSKENIRNTKAAVASLGLSTDELEELTALLQTGAASSNGTLPAPMLELLRNNPAIQNAGELVLQLGELYKLLGNNKSGIDFNIAQLMITWMSDLQTNDSTVLLRYLKDNPLVVKDALRDPLTGIINPLDPTVALLKNISPFNKDPIIGSSLNETLLANRSGGSQLTGGGGSDLYVIALRTNPFAPKTIITDFSQDSGSKVVLDTTDYSGTIKQRYRVARNSKKITKLSQSKVGLIYDKQSHTLLINANGKAKGYGNNGGAAVEFSNAAHLSANEILIYNGNGVDSLNGSSYDPLTAQ